MASNGGSNSLDEIEEAAVGDERQRHCSEGSVSGDETDPEMRLRRTQNFAIPGIPASPPKFVSLEEIMKAATGMKNMVLAHEIAVDREFKLKKLEPPENSVHRIVRETMHRAFWDLLKIQLIEDPPNYSQALVLLEDIKEGLLSVLLPQHTQMKQNILELLDKKVIEQQIEAGTLNFKEYAHCVISIMAKMCAPARDERIKELSETTDVVEVFKGILEVLDLMKLDMANFTIQVIRPDIIATSIEYEKKKFKDFLEIQQDGLAITRQWLLRHLSSSYPATNSPQEIKKITEITLCEAYLELLEWKPGTPYPETVALDEARFQDLGACAYRAAVIGTVFLLVSSYAANLQGIASFRETTVKHLGSLLGEVSNAENLDKAINNIRIQVVKDTNECLKKHGFKELDEVTIELLEAQIKAISKPDHKINGLVRKRIKEFLLQTIASPTAAPVRIPPGLSALQTELTSITGNFLHLVSHNRAVFSEYYIQIIKDALQCN